MTHELSFDLSGRKVVVTGAASGIGAAAAQAFAMAGAHVVVHYHRSGAEARKMITDITAVGGRAIAIGSDLSKPDGAASLIEQSIDALGGIDVLVNNVGDPLMRIPVVEITDENYQSIMDLNMGSVFWTTRAALPALRQDEGGAIVVVTSAAARMGGGPGTVIYAAAKAAAATFARGLAKELAADGVRVNTVAPGMIDTDLHRRRTSAETLQAMTQLIPMGRIGEPADCIGAILFLASNELSGYVTGQSLEVNGGFVMP